MNDSYDVVGKNPPRIDSLAKVTGQARYATDLAFPGMLHAKLLRSPHAHARVKRIDCSRAESLPGVRAVATILEVPRVVEYWFFLRSPKKREQMFLRDDVVRFRGDPVLAVAADSEALAEKALESIEVEYEPLPALLTPDQALQSHALPIHQRGNIAFRMKKSFGNIEQGFKEAVIVEENTYRTSKQKHTPLEPIGTCVADYNAGGKLTVYSSTQLPHWSQMYLAGALGLPQNRVRIIKPFTGGAFGGRCGLIHGLEMFSSRLARETGRPVKMSFSREEEFIGTESRHPMIIKLKTGVDKNGRIVANDIDITADVGGYGTHYIGVIADCLSTGVGLYRVPHVDFKARAVFTNTPLCGAFRGYGNPQFNFAQESQVDALAARIGMDPFDFRMRNYRGLGEIDPVFNDEIRSCGLEECLKKGGAAFGWKNKYSRPPEAGPRKKGVGLAVMLHGTGAARALPDPASATVMVNADGTANLLTAAADEGQGNRTVLAQIAAEVLGVDFEKIAVSETDTDVTPLDGGTHGSRQTYCGGLAVEKAAGNARDKILEFAALELGMEADQLRIKAGIISAKNDPDRQIGLDGLMHRMQITDMNINRQVVGHSSGVAPAMPGYYGACFAEVEVDTETGEVRVVKLTGAYDVGRAIHPENVKGQIIGGGVMGIGWALTEDLHLGEDGRVLNGNLRDYRLLRTCDVPELEAIIVESREPTGPFGAKGIGEGGMVCIASAIANAIHHAAGIRMKELCITPEKILAALEAVNQEP